MRLAASLFVFAFGFAGAGGTVGAEPLARGRTRHRNIALGEIHRWPLLLREGQVLELHTRATGRRITLTLKAPDGRTVIDGYWVAVGDTKALLRWIAEVPGIHTLEVDAGTSTVNGRYELRMAEPRAARREDRKRLEAQTMHLEIRTLLTNPDRERLDRTVEICRRGVTIAHELEDPALEGHFLLGLMRVRSFDGDVRGALEVAQQAQALLHGRDAYKEADSVVFMGMAHMDLGEYQKSLEHLQRAAARYRSMGNRRGEASALSEIGMLYGELNDTEAELRIYDQVIPILRAEGDTVGEAHKHNNAGVALHALGDLRGALARLQRALSLYQAAGRQREEGMTLANIGDLHRDLHHPDQALAFLGQALTLIRAIGAPQKEADILRGLGHVYRDGGEYDKALDHYRQSLALATATGRALDQAGTLMAVASLERARGNLTEARRLMKDVNRWFDAAREGIDSEQLRLSQSALLREGYDLHVDILMRLHTQQPSEGLDREALQLADSSHGRTLAEMLREARVDLSRAIDPELLRRERELGERLSAKAAPQLPTLAPTPDEREHSRLDKDIGELTRQLDHVRTEIRQANPRLAALERPAPLAVTEIQSLLDDETVLLEYQLDDGGSHAWAVSSDALASAPLDKGDAIETLARRLHERLTQRNRVPADVTAVQFRRLLSRADVDSARTAADLSEKVLGALPAPRARRLVIVADGALHYVPFAALPIPASWGGRGDPLVARYEVVSVPSASVLALLRQDRRERPRALKEVAVFADPVFDRDDTRVRLSSSNRAASVAPKRARLLSAPSALSEDLNRFRPGRTMSGVSLPRLEYTRELATTLLQGVPAAESLRAIDFGASREAALGTALSQYRTIVFATHGLLNAQYPELSGIALSMVDEKGLPKDGFLRLHDIYNLELNADLVVLGACETGLGREIKGEGLVGLARGFLYAGATRVLVSLWKVDEEATVSLLQEFHRSTRRGQPAAAALREAQLRLRQDPRWSSPFFWAGFVLQGEWKSRND